MVPPVRAITALKGGVTFHWMALFPRREGPVLFFEKKLASERPWTQKLWI